MKSIEEYKRIAKKKMEEVTLERLVKFHRIVKEHPYRLERMGSSKHYADALDKMGDEFYYLVKKQYIDLDKKFPFKRWIWAHQYWSCILAISNNYEMIEEYMTMMEAYIQTIHAYYESGGKLNFFYMDVGYSSYSKKQHEDNPLRSLKFIFYPQFNEYDVTKIHAKNELVFYERWLKEQQAGLRKERKKYKLKSKEEKEDKLSRWGIKWHEERIKWHTKRIKRLKEIISLKV